MVQGVVRAFGVNLSTCSAGRGGAVKGIETGGRWSRSGRTRRTRSPTVAVDRP